MNPYPALAELIPQSGSMVLLDEVVEAAGPRIACRVRLRPDSLFAAEGRVPAVMAIEYMAQAVAAYAGLRARAAGEPIRIGYLLGTRELALETDHFDVGDELVVEATHVWGDEQIGSFRCTVARDGLPLAAATVNVYQGDAGEGPR